VALEGRSEVLVVGAGPAGCAAGLVLARAGIDVCVVDRARFPRDKTCGDSVSDHAVALIASLGGGDRIERTPHAVVRHAAAEFPDGSRVSRSYPHPAYIVPRYRLDDCLLQTLQSTGARVVQACHVDSFRREGGRFAGAQGPGFSWSAKLIIAAHGAGPLGLSALGQAPARGQYLGLSATAYFRNLRFPYGLETADHFFDHELPYGYGWIFPPVDGRSNVGVYLRADAYARTGKTLGDLLAQFQKRHAARFEGAEQMGAVRTWLLPLASRPVPVSAPGLLLAGDAAGFVDPLSGEGIWQALYSGMRAGQMAAEARVGGDFDGRLAQRYQRECAHRLRRPSLAKVWLQRVMARVVERDLYRLPWVHSALSWGYSHNLLEIAKS
jgi:geranylgeranyl reductase family protein